MDFWETIIAGIFTKGASVLIDEEIRKQREEEERKKQMENAGLTALSGLIVGGLAILSEINKKK